MDFGLKTYLTLSDGTRIENPLFLRQGLGDLRKASRRLFRSGKDSARRLAARLALDRIHEEITNRRDDWQWKLAHELCRAYDTLCVGDLQLTGMSRLWGRKMADLAYGSFMQKLEHTAVKYGCEVRKVDRYYPSSRTCGCCGYVYEHLDLCDRQWTCPQCGTTLDRYVNAATNIMRQGVASSGSPRKTKVTLRKGR